MPQVTSSKKEIWTMGSYSLLTLSIMIGFMYLNQFCTEVLKTPPEALAVALGIGKAIITYLSQICVDRNYERMEWLCLTWNEPSMGYYRAIGSREIDIVRTFRLMPDDMRRMVGQE